MAEIGKWEMDDGQVDENDAAPENTPVEYPRSDESRDGGLPKFEENSAGNADEGNA